MPKKGNNRSLHIPFSSLFSRYFKDYGIVIYLSKIKMLFYKRNGSVCMRYYELNFLGIKRQLPILRVPSGINVAGFNYVGDMELIKLAAKNLSDYIIEKKIPCDIILTTELKGLPISQEVAGMLNIDYVCLRKAKKSYMLNPISIASESITSGRSEYFVSEQDYNKLAGKRIVFIDDVFSTGATLSHIMKFINKNNLSLNHALFILKEGFEGKDEELEFSFENVAIKCCGFLPLPKD